MSYKRIPLYLVIVLTFSFVISNLGYLHASDYVIGEEDVLNISVWGSPELSLTAIVRPDGKISLPLLNDIQASGYTPMELKKKITRELKKFINSPNVTIIVTQLNSQRVYVHGEVLRPGIMPLKRKMTLYELLLTVGVKDTSDLKRSFLRRKGKKMDVDFYSLYEKQDLSLDIPILPDDQIYIPDNFQSRITVIGEVNSPQIINFKEGFTVLDIILMAGGLTQYADPNDTVVIRKDGDATKTINIRVKDIMKKGAIEKNIPVLEGDIILVPESFF